MNAYSASCMIKGKLVIMQNAEPSKWPPNEATPLISRLNLSPIRYAHVFPRQRQSRMWTKVTVFAGPACHWVVFGGAGDNAHVGSGLLR